jgi:DNA-binding GntR family transcriptional regulator
MRIRDGELSKLTLTSSVYDRLRDEILSATLRPGTRLQTRQLGERFGVGLSPIREALSILSSEGLAARRDRRGFIAATVSEADLDDLTRARCWINEIGLRQSIARGDAEWEEEIVLAFHRLLQTPRHHPGHKGRNPAWELAHARFHRSLIAACGSEWLIKAATQMFDAAERYRHIARLAGATRPPNREHRQIMNAVIERDADRAVELNNMHLRRTSDMVREVLKSPSGKTAVAARRKSRPGTAQEMTDMPRPSARTTPRTLGRQGEG